MENKKRLVNFEVLRCALMLMIVVIHFFAHGEKYASVSGDFCFKLDTLCGGINFMISQITDIIAVTAVNLFIFITGYFMIESHKLSLQKIVKLWVPVAFYSVTLAAVQFGGGNIGLHDLLKAFIPIKGNSYWFVTNYFALVLFAPFLAKIAEGLSKKGYLVGLAVMAFLMLELYKFPYGFTYKNGYGTSLLFFVLLFFTGGYYRKYGNLIPLEVLHLKNNRNLFYAIVILVFLFGAMRGGCFGDLKAIVSTTPYHSFTFVVSVALFQYFLSIKFNETWFTKLCCFLSPYTFAVYLIHDNNYVRDWLWRDVIHLENTLNSPYYILLLVFIPLSIYISCMAIEYLRVKIFDMVGLTSFLRKLYYEIKIW